MVQIISSQITTDTKMYGNKHLAEIAQFCHQEIIERKYYYILSFIHKFKL